MNNSNFGSAHEEISTSDVRSIKSGEFVAEDDDLVIVISKNSKNHPRHFQAIDPQSSVPSLFPLIRKFATDPRLTHYIVECFENAVYAAAFKAGLSSNIDFEAHTHSGHLIIGEAKRPKLSTDLRNKIRNELVDVVSSITSPVRGSMDPLFCQKPVLNISSPEQLRTHVFNSAKWLTAQELSAGAGFTGKNKSAQPNKWKKDCKIFAVSRDGKDYFPAYAVGDDGKPLPVMKEIIPILTQRKTPLAVATWFASVNGWLSGNTPMSVLTTRPTDVVEAARMEISPSEHG